MGDDKDERGPRPIRIELIQDLSRVSSPIEGFLRRYRHRIKTVFADGSRTETYTADVVDRDLSRRDAVAVAVYARAKDEPHNVDDTRVLLRQQVRYAAYLRDGDPLTTEIVAGLIEDDEAPADAAVRELWEEAGLRARPQDLVPIGSSFYSSPGILTEKIVPMALEVSDDELDRVLAHVPPGDGSPFEEGAFLEVMTLKEALFSPRDRAGDAKTEITLFRLMWMLKDVSR